MIDEHAKVKKELEKYKSIVDKFTFSSERLDMLLKDQRAVFNHAGLGYYPNNKHKCTNNIFSKSTFAKTRISTCYYYGKIGHKFYECNLRKTPRQNHRVTNLRNKVKQVWIPKKTKVERLGL